MLQQWLKSRQKLLKDTQDFSTRSWFRWCAGRITASVMHAVFATSLETPGQSVVNCVSYPENGVCYTNKMEHEEDAWKAYTQKIAAHHYKLQVRLCSFIVNTIFPELGATHNVWLLWGGGAWRLSVLLNTQRTALSRHWMHRIKRKEERKKEKEKKR